MNRIATGALVSVAFASVSSCNFAPEKKQIAHEAAERDAAVDAAMNHPASTGNPAATGAPLPPLPGVNAPAPAPENQAQPVPGNVTEDSTEHDQH